MTKITNRDDVSLLVHTFYDKIRQHELLGPIFNGHISEEQWPAHLSKLTDFWESNLFGVRTFRGSPSKAHVNVDKNLNHTISQNHFAQWLQLWFETINELFEGELADRAKEMARRMSTGQYIHIWQNRPRE
ncbi:MULTISPECIES: group III truncated hemoglobin [Maribacter]|uniref:Hemoglobin n=1 Tax=Maribacter dokdonensis TaxID=320912 RepID=A0A1H4JI79_9FLAO|nr:MULTISPECIES: group III truncated hemoglobin [Maribacter]APA63559.1 globin [Maribacter sp. 1_2014MBL_MicDiv]KSA11559.1 Globin family protein [Maribacter dokdonensis DSW-8]PHN92021.1 globin [Maribacter sp. 6B07]SEB45328.1 hemoglobin [Maribacter dokdonensis]